MLSKFGGVIVSAIVVFGFVGVMVLWLVGKPPTSSTELSMLVGALISAFSAVVQFWVGSSAGSKAKDETLASALSNK